MDTLYNKNVSGALSLITVNGAKYQLGKDATSEVAGIAKLYDSVTDGITDGAVTPNAVYDAIATLSGDTETNLSTLEGKLDTLIGEDSDKSARTIANEELAAQLVPANAKEALDTLQEIAAWIQQHPDDAAAMNTAINNRKVLQTAVADADATTAGNTVTFVDYVTQNENGEITVHKAAVTIADGSHNGLLSSSDFTKLQNLPSNAGLITQLDGKSDKVANATAGNFAGLDANGNLTDSGSKAADFATAAQGAKADTALQAADIVNKKNMQTAVADPTASGNAAAFIDSISQNENGEITVTKKNVQAASASQAGLMSAADYSKLAAISATVSDDTLTIVTQAA